LVHCCGDDPMNRRSILPLRRILQGAVAIAVAILLIAGLVSPGVPGRAAGTAGQGSYLVLAAGAQQAAQQVRASGGTVTSELEVIRGVAAWLSPTSVQALSSAPGIRAVYPNRPVRMVGDGEGEEGGTGKFSPATDYPDVTGADLVWEQGNAGVGVSVAVLDTGISRHRGLVRGIDKKKGRLLAWKDFVEGRKNPIDPNGHGTHIAGIIANSQVGDDGEWNGMAPGVDLVVARVLDQNGAGTYETVIRGIQWVLDHKDRYNIRVMNLSLVSAPGSAYWADPLNLAVMRAWASGISVVVAAGNEGPNPMTVGVPGNNPYAITVGAFTDNYTPGDWSDDYITPFSAAGPTLDAFVKPDLVAPGAHMVSTMLPHSTVASLHQANQVANQYFAMAGTSQAAAVVSGVTALMMARQPDLSPDQAKYRLLVTALPWIDVGTTDALYSVWQQGAGRVNALDAVFGEIQGTANSGLDLAADLAGTAHFEGYSIFDETTGLFRLRGDFEQWANGYGTWSGGHGAWSGGYGSWSGDFGAWTGGHGAWSGGHGAWSGGHGAWSGGEFGTWAGGHGAWSGGYTAWAGGHGAWSGSIPWAGSLPGEAGFVETYLAGFTPGGVTTVNVNHWVYE
jgi:serine protease AprX